MIYHYSIKDTCCNADHIVQGWRKGSNSGRVKLKGVRAQIFTYHSHLYYPSYFSATVVSSGSPHKNAMHFSQSSILLYKLSMNPIDIASSLASISQLCKEYTLNPGHLPRGWRHVQCSYCASPCARILEVGASKESAIWIHRWSCTAWFTEKKSLFSAIIKVSSGVKHMRGYYLGTENGAFNNMLLNTHHE